MFSIQRIAIAVIAALQCCCAQLDIYVDESLPDRDLVRDKLLSTSNGDLVLLFTADSQHYFKCVETNFACKKESEQIRMAYGLSIDCDLRPEVAARKNISESQRKRLMDYCVKSESQYSNDVQKEVMSKLVSALPSVPTALVINGDLTSYGHLQELEQFKKTWLKFPIPILPGLGNHDYENNVNDCVGNHCANRMLTWLTDFGRLQGLQLDYRVTQSSSLLFWKNSYTGSFAYSKVVCSENGRTCARVIQLHNRLNYATQIDGPLNQWTITSSTQWLSQELRNARNSMLPIFINLHYLDAVSLKIIKDGIRTNFAQGNQQRPKIFVLFAHFHHMHSVITECAGYGVPFIFVGSVPNNRFSLIKVKADPRASAELYLMSSNPDNSTTILNFMQPQFAPCAQL